MLNIHRVRDIDMQHFPGNYYASFHMSNCFMIKENEIIVAIANFIIQKQVNALLDIHFFIVIDNNKRQEVSNIILDEFYWFNPFVNQVIYNKEIYINKKTMNIFKIHIKDLSPGQLSIDKRKLDKVSTWVSKPEDIIVHVTIVNEKKMVTDGHTRLIEAIKQGFDYVYAFISDDTTNMELYKEVERWCKEENILSLYDLRQWIISSDKHQERWIDRCQNFLKNSNV